MKPAQKAITKTDLAKYVEKELQCSRRISLRLINGILKLIQQNLAEGNRVQLNSFGTFEARNRASHRGKNPKTGETFLVKARRITVFKPAKTLKNIHPKK